MKINQEKELLSLDADTLIKLIKDGKEKFKTKYPDITYLIDENSYIFVLKGGKEIKKYIVFENNVEVKLNTINKEIKSFSFFIRTNLELFNQIKQSEFDFDRITILNKETKKLKGCINVINIYVKNNVLNLQIIKADIPDIKFDTNCLQMGKDYPPQAYSKYFELYFPSAGKNKDNSFKFIYSPKRREIRNNIVYLNDNETIKKYKLTGPFATGKSMTLFKISKSLINVIYINLKIMKKYAKNYYAFLEILFEESSKVDLSKKNQDEFKKK